MYPIVSFFTGWFLQETTVCEKSTKQQIKCWSRYICVQSEETQLYFLKFLVFFNQYYMQCPFSYPSAISQNIIVLIMCVEVHLFLEAYFFFLHKVHKSCPFDLHGLTLSVIQRQDEMEKIGFSEVGRGLLFIMCPCQADTAAGRKQETMSVKHRTPGILDDGEADGKTLQMHKHAWARGRFLDLSQ